MYEIAILCVIRFSTYGTWIRKEKNIDSCHSWEYFNAPMCSFPLYGPDRPSYLRPSVFRSSFTLESVRAHFFLLSPSSSPLFFSSLGWNWKSSIETRIHRLFSSLSLLSPRLLLLLALLIFDWNQRSAQILGPLCSWELYDSSRFRPIFLSALD